MGEPQSSIAVAMITTMSRPGGEEKRHPYLIAYNQQASRHGKLFILLRRIETPKTTYKEDSLAKE
jgi:hypothetical protein